MSHPRNKDGFISCHRNPVMAYLHMIYMIILTNAYTYKDKA